MDHNEAYKHKMEKKARGCIKSQNNEEWGERERREKHVVPPGVRE